MIGELCGIKPPNDERNIRATIIHEWNRNDPDRKGNAVGSTFLCGSLNRSLDYV